MASETEQVLRAAAAWWRMKKPLPMLWSDHLKNPTVNCTSEAENELAKAVVKWMTSRSGSNEGERHCCGCSK